MVDVAPLDLPEVTQAAAGDFFIIELASGGTRRISRLNAGPDIGVVPALGAAVDIVNDTVLMFDATNGRLRQIPFQDFIFGNFGNSEEAANFTLGVEDAIQAIEVNDPALVTITLDGNAAGIGGADFIIANFNDANVTVAAQNITMFVEGVGAANATIRARRSATITVNNASNQAIFSGG